MRTTGVYFDPLFLKPDPEAPARLSAAHELLKKVPAPGTVARVSQYIHGGTDDREIARLEKQAHWTAPYAFRRFDAAPGMRVLDLATGVGAMAGQLRRTYPGIHLIGVDLSPTQLTAAKRNHGDVGYARADATHLPFRDAHFDRVHCSWFLEHIPNPVAVLKEVRRVLKPGGYCHFTEVDNATLRLVPPQPAVDEVMNALNSGQIAAGGDPFIGPKLQGYFTAAGFSQVRDIPTVMEGTENDVATFRGLTDEFAEIFDGLDESLGAAWHERLKAGATAMRTLPSIPGASMYYCAQVMQGFR